MESPGCDLEPVVRNLLDRRAPAAALDAGALRSLARRAGVDRGGAGGPDVVQRQVEREGAAHAGRAAQLDLAAEQVRQLAADREAKAGAAVFAAGAGVGLLERLEDDLLLLRRDADAGVGDLEGHHRRRLLEHRMLGAPAARRRPRRSSRTPPCAVNLKALDSRFLSTCCSRLESVTMLRPRSGSSSTSNASCRFSASWRNGRADRVEQVGEEDLLGLDRDRAGFDLGQVENVADQVSRSVPAP